MSIDEFVEQQMYKLKAEIDKQTTRCRPRNTILPSLRGQYKAYKRIYDYLNSPEYMKQEFLEQVKQQAGEYYQK